MKNEFELAFNEIKNQRALPQETVIEALRTALISAYRRYSGASAAQMVDATIDPATGRTKILVEKLSLTIIFQSDILQFVDVLFFNLSVVLKLKQEFCFWILLV